MTAPIRRAQLDPDVPVAGSKDPVRFATTVDDTLNGLAVRDSVTPVAGNRALVKDQSTGSQNGTYLAAVGAWTRTEDFDESIDADPATVISVSEGTDNGGTSWQLTTPAPIILGTTSLTFEITGRAGSDPGAHGTDHNPDGSDAPIIAVPVGLDSASVNSSGAADSYTRSSHTHEIDTTTGTISEVNAGDAPSGGSAAGLPKRDHQHGVSTAAPPATSASAAAPAVGSASSLMRSDASIQVDVSGTLDGLAVGAAGADGAGDGVALKTHEHAVPAATAIEITDSTSSAGDDGNFAHANHEHGHGDRGGGALHADATASVDGFMTAAQFSKLASIVEPRFRDPKDSVRFRTTADDTLSGFAARDGVTPVAGDRAAVFDQTTVTQDGLYIAAAGAWTRADDFQAGDGSAGAFFPIEEGTTHGDKVYLVTNDEPNDIIGTDGLALLLINAGTPRGAGAGLSLSGNDLQLTAADASIVVDATTVGVGVLQSDAMHGDRGGGAQHADVVAGGADGFMTGADKTKIDSVETGATADAPQQEPITAENITNADTPLADTLNATPKDNAWLRLYLNGVFQRQGAGKDYSISGTTITWLALTGTAINMKASDTVDAVYVS